MTGFNAATTLGAVALAATLTATLAGCNTYVKRDDYDPTIAGLRDADARNTRDIESLRGDLATLKRDLEARLQRHDGAIAQLSGRIRVDSTAHFAYDDARLPETDKAALQQFAGAVRDHHPNILVTVEGFADPAGDSAYNKRLGQRRADAVRSYLVEAGVPADKVRAVSYGEDRNRQVQPGAWGDKGPLNRRTTLVVDYVATAASASGSEAG
ncbi:MAG: OmpA family protein [Sinimarinibacterium sp.]